MTLVKKLERSDLGDVNVIDSTFTVDSKLILATENGQLRFSVEPITSYSKNYPAVAVEYHEYLHSDEKAVFLAYLDHQPVGRICLARNWNNFAYIADLAIDAKHRRRGIGRDLIEQAKRWATEMSLSGVMAETQDCNVAACRLYERCGFILAGFDRMLYRGINPATEEIALFWYFDLDKTLLHVT